MTAAAATLLVVCGALAAYGTLGSGDPSERGHGQADGNAMTGRGPATAQTEVAYEVLGEGTADIAYREADAEGIVRNARLPWRKTVRLPQGTTPAVSVTLGEKGGRAGCGLTVAGRHVQRSTAEGAFGRGSCASTESDAAAPRSAPAPVPTSQQGTP
ncbi:MULTISPECIES: hypothetical protein [unclassified Streptomyces]|uniref:hypothetical protein n=1 Tax=unclassified Streptomyces TaxID=2593676 RepID=UPI000A67FB10|nr:MULTISPECIES: hypothetical protein [unclassified Streptomyces]